MKIILGIAALFTTIFVTFSGSKSELDKIVTKYFIAINKNEQQHAKNYLSHFVVQESEEIENFLQQNFMEKAISSKWQTISIKENVARIKGDLLINKTQHRYAHVVLLKEQGTWKIYSIAKQKSMTQNSINSPLLDEIKQMVSASMHNFYAAIKTKNMQAFYQTFSAYWKAEINSKDLEKIYATFYDKTENLLFIREQKPEIDYHSIIKDDILLVSGSFSHNNKSVFFSQKYIYEACAWKLLSFEFDNSFIKGSNFEKTELDKNL